LVAIPYAVLFLDYIFNSYKIELRKGRDGLKRSYALDPNRQVEGFLELS